MKYKDKIGDGQAWLQGFAYVTFESSEGLAAVVFHHYIYFFVFFNYIYIFCRGLRT